MELMQEAQETEENGAFISLDDTVKELGFNAKELQNNN
jgi:hypothetical protein